MSYEYPPYPPQIPYPNYENAGNATGDFTEADALTLFYTKTASDAKYMNLATPTTAGVFTSTNTTDITVGNSATGAIQTLGGISAAKSIQALQRIYSTTSTLSQPGYSFTADQNSGLHYLSNDSIGMVAGAQVRVGAINNGCYVPDKLCVGTSTHDSYKTLIQGSDGSTLACLNLLNTSSGNLRAVLQTQGTGQPYLLLDNSLQGYTIGMLVGGTLAIGPTAGLPSSKTNGLTISQSNVVDLLTSAKINSITQHNVIYTSTASVLSGVSPLQITSTPKSIAYTITRVGRMVSLDLGLVDFAVSVGGPIVEINIYSIMNSHGLTINSMPTANPTGVLKYLAPMSITRNAGAIELATGVYFTGIDGAYSSMRLRIQAIADFSGALNSICGSANLSWIARADGI